MEDLRSKDQASFKEGNAAGPDFRAFVAVELPEELQGWIGKFQAALQRAGIEGALPQGSRLVWVRGEALHLTLRFLGNIPETKIPEIEAAMERAARKVAPFEFALQEIGGAPSLKKPRVLWLELENPAPLEALETALSEELAALGIPKEVRAFRAHVTLARVKEARVKGPARGSARPRAVSHDVTALVQAAFQKEGLHFHKEEKKGAGAGKGVESAPTFVVYTYSLVESRLTPKGPQYRQRARVALGGKREGPGRGGE